MDIENLLSYIRINNFSEWVRVGFGLKNYCSTNNLNDKEFCNYWVQWCRVERGYKNDEDCIKTWNNLGKSFSSRPITIATLIYKAKRNGWEDK